MGSWVAGEFFLKNRPNGGTVVLYRTAFISTILYVVAITLKSALAPRATLHFDTAEARAVMADTIPWFGAIFAGVYVALYTRFASQWSYLAGLYNQMMQAQVETAPTTDDRDECLALWQAAFIEDAEDLHLARKPMFAAVIADLLSYPAVRSAYVGYSPGGEPRLRKLEAQVEVVQQRMRRRYKVAPTPTPAPTPAPVEPIAPPAPDNAM